MPENNSSWSFAGIAKGTARGKILRREFAVGEIAGGFVAIGDDDNRFKLTAFLSEPCELQYEHASWRNLAAVDLARISAAFESVVPTLVRDDAEHQPVAPLETAGLSRTDWRKIASSDSRDDFTVFRRFLNAEGTSHIRAMFDALRSRKRYRLTVTVYDTGGKVAKSIPNSSKVLLNLELLKDGSSSDVERAVRKFMKSNSAMRQIVRRKIAQLNKLSA